MRSYRQCSKENRELFKQCGHIVNAPKKTGCRDRCQTAGSRTDRRDGANRATHIATSVAWNAVYQPAGA